MKLATLNFFAMVAVLSTSFRKHTVNFGSEMVQAKHVSGKNILYSMNVDMGLDFMVHVGVALKRTM